jgi:hypothetical protein
LEGERRPAGRRRERSILFVDLEEGQRDSE